MSTVSTPPTYVLLDDLVGEAGCHRQTIFRALKRGALRGTRVGNVRLVELSSFAQWRAARQLRDSAAQIARGGAA